MRRLLLMAAVLSLMATGVAMAGTHSTSTTDGLWSGETYITGEDYLAWNIEVGRFPQPAPHLECTEFGERPVGQVNTKNGGPDVWLDYDYFKLSMNATTIGGDDVFKKKELGNVLGPAGIYTIVPTDNTFHLTTMLDFDPATDPVTLKIWGPWQSTAWFSTFAHQDVQPGSGFVKHRLKVFCKTGNQPL